MENMEYCGTHVKCKCGCHKVTGALVFLIGLVFLLGDFDVFTPRAVSIIWPILLILIGLKKSFGRNMCSCCDKVKIKENLITKI